MRCAHWDLLVRLRPYVRGLASRSLDPSRHAGAIRCCDVCGHWIEIEYGLGSYRPGVRVRVVSEVYIARLAAEGIRVSRRRRRVALSVS